MKKALALLLILAFLFSLTACAASTPTTSSSSKPAASSAAPSAAAGASAAAASSSAPSAAGKPVEITAAFVAFPNGLDSQAEDSTCNMSISHDVYDHLMWWNADKTFSPEVAKSYKQVDPLTWEFDINLDYVFQNGDKLTMDDLVFSVLHLKDVAKTADIGNLIDSVTASGSTLTVKAKVANNSIVNKIIDKTIVLNKAYVTKGGQDALVKNPIGTGPYKVTKFTPGTSCVVETWSGYPFKKPQINKITYIGIPEDANRYIAVETGKAQFAALVSNLELDLAAKNNKLSVVKADSVSVNSFVFNCETGIFKDVNLRRALMYAFDRDSFCALKGGRAPCASMVFCGYPNLYSEPSTLPKYDLAKAKQLLADAGYSAAKPLKFELVYWTADPGLELYQSTLKSIGVEMTLKQVEFSVYLSKEGPGDFTMAFTSQTNKNGSPLTDLDRIDNTLIGKRDICRYNNPQVQDLVVKMRTAKDTELKPLADQISTILGQDAPMFAAFLRPIYCVADKNLSGVVVRSDMQFAFRYATYKG